MAGKSSKLFCHKCNHSGGTLTRRRAGNGDKNEYFYMMHYDPTKKSKKRSCYLGGYAGLTDVSADSDDERDLLYYELFDVLGNNDTSKHLNLDKDKKARIWYYLLNLMINMGWPKRFVLEKYFAERFKLNLTIKYANAEEELENSAFPEKRRLKVDHSKFDDYLNEDLSELFTSDEFRQIKMKLGLA